MTTSNSAPERPHWSVPQKIAFRFFFAFFMLFVILGGNDGLPFYNNIYYPFINFFQGFIAWAAKSTFEVVVNPFNREFGESGGDAVFDYMLYLFIIILSVVITIIWSHTGRKRANYNNLFYWLLVILRYYTASSMTFFGIAKLLRVQFPVINIGRLMERVGDMSPMGLAWTYMSYSQAFNYLIGFAELLCAVLLFFRQTKKLGATLGVVLLVNIVAINFCFDVCVKISSTTLLLMCLFMMAPDSGRFIDFFIRNRDVSASDLTPHRFTASWKNISLNGFKYALILYILYWNYYTLAKFIPLNNYAAANALKPPLYGLYEVKEFLKNHDTLKPLTADTIRWSKFWISRPGAATVKLMNDSTKSFQFRPDTLKHIITANTYADTIHKFYLHYTIQKPNVMILQGRWKHDSIYVRLNKVDLSSFRLISRGFHFINEVPYNK